MNKYKFALSICGGYADGFITVECDNPDGAQEKAMDSFVDRWIEAFPELEVDYHVELESVEIDQTEVESKLRKALELLPSGEELEINSDGYEVYALRYNESRGSAEYIDGMEDVLWYEDDANYDDKFDPQVFIDKYADAVCGL